MTGDKVQIKLTANPNQCLNNTRYMKEMSAPIVRVTFSFILQYRLCECSRIDSVLTVPVGQIQEMFVGDDYDINSKNITRSSGKK
jgi:hypothetical protein